MTEQEVFAKIIEAIQPVNPINLDTEILSSEDFNSLGMFNLLAEFKPLGVKIAMRDLLTVDTVGELVKLIVSRAP